MSAAARGVGARGARRLVTMPLLATALVLAVWAGASAGRPAEPSARGAAGSCDPLSAAAKRGKLLFRTGVTAAGRPLAGLLDGGAVSLNGRDAACASCHGPSGAGTEEGLVVAPALTPARLFGRAERGYTDAALSIALRDGRTPEGHALRAPMPRFRMEDADRDDLLAYLRCVGRDPDPGVSEGSVRVGAALPLTGPRAELGAAVRDALKAGFAEANAPGGVFRRRIELVVEDSGALGDDGATARLIGAGVLALVGSAGDPDAPRDAQIEARIEAEGIPLVAPIGPPPENAGAHAFYLFPGPEVLARAAVAHAARGAGSARLLVAHGGGDAGARWRRGAQAEAAQRGLAAPQAYAFDAGRLDAELLIDAARAASAETLLVAGAASDLAAALAALERLPGARLYAPASTLSGATRPLSGPLHASPLRARVFFVHPGLLDPLFGAGLTELRSALRRHGFEGRHLAFQVSAFAGTRVLVSALQRAGNPPTRDGLVSALESLRDVETGLVPPLSFSRNRHTGVLGAYLMRVGDAAGALTAASDWIGITP